MLEKILEYKQKLVNQIKELEKLNIAKPTKPQYPSSPAYIKNVTLVMEDDYDQHSYVLLNVEDINKHVLSMFHLGYPRDIQYTKINNLKYEVSNLDKKLTEYNELLTKIMLD